MHTPVCGSPRVFRIRKVCLHSTKHVVLSDGESSAQYRGVTSSIGKYAYLIHWSTCRAAVHPETTK
jgi:hypothetical protein